jgi:hypothetical protein
MSTLSPVSVSVISACANLILNLFVILIYFYFNCYGMKHMPCEHIFKTLPKGCRCVQQYKMVDMLALCATNETYLLTLQVDMFHLLYLSFPYLNSTHIYQSQLRMQPTCMETEPTRQGLLTCVSSPYLHHSPRHVHGFRLESCTQRSPTSLFRMTASYMVSSIRATFHVQHCECNASIFHGANF